MYLRVFLVFVFAVAITITAIGQDPAPTPTGGGYLIGPGDEITGKVMGESDFNFVAIVDENGKLEVPFVEKPIVAKCLTERELRTEVTKLLSKYLRNPQISIHADRKSRPPVSIYGAVQQQQQFNLTRRAYLLELITVAGGESEKSAGIITVFRTRPPMCGETSQSDEWKVATDSGLGAPSKTYSLTSLRQGREGANPEIFPGDVVLVHKASPVYIVGEVVRPGELNIPEGGLPLTQALAMASGINRDAKKKTLKIYRRKAGSPQPEVIDVNYDQIKKGLQSDVMLEPFDIVEIGKSKKSIGDILLETVMGIPGRIPIVPF